MYSPSLNAHVSLLKESYFRNSEARASKREREKEPEKIIMHICADQPCERLSGKRIHIYIYIYITDFLPFSGFLFFIYTININEVVQSVYSAISFVLEHQVYTKKDKFNFIRAALN